MVNWSLACVAAAVIGMAVQAHAQPTGTQWDCTLSGKAQRGLAFLTFADDGTFSGYQLLSAIIANKKSDDPRSPFGEVGRYPDDDRGTNGASGSTNLFGFSRIFGPWGYDVQGRIIGHYTLHIGGDTESDPGYTNAVSFIGKVVPGKRLTLVASTPNGKLTYSCVPYRTTPYFGGPWYGSRFASKQTFLEFFTLTSFQEFNPFGGDYADLGDYPGIYYSPAGEGPGYNNEIFTLVSSRKKIGFAFESTRWGETNSVLSATIGGWSSGKTGIKTKTSGVDHSGLPINFDGNLPIDF